MLAAILPTLFDSSQRRCRCKLELITKLLMLLSGKVDDFFQRFVSLNVLFTETTDCFDRSIVRSINCFWLVLRRSLWHTFWHTGVGSAYVYIWDYHRTVNARRSKKKKKKYVVSIEYIQINVRNHGRDFVSGLGLYLGSIAFLYCFLCRDIFAFFEVQQHTIIHTTGHTLYT